MEGEDEKAMEVEGEKEKKEEEEEEAEEEEEGVLTEQDLLLELENELVQLDHSPGIYVQEPPKNLKGSMASRAQVKKGVKIASERISIEQSFGRLKNSFKLLQQTIPVTTIRELYYYIIVGCYFCNTYMKGFNTKISKKGEYELH